MAKKPKCSKCGKPSVITRDYEGRSLCKQHFCDSIEKKAKKTVSKFDMIEPGDRVAVALSGGKDSAVSLHIMNEILEPRRDVEIFAISIDEGIKGSRDLSIKEAKKLCKQLGIKQHIFTFKKEIGKSLDQFVKQEKLDNEGICAYCGIARRWILNKHARLLKASKICYGMNLNDESESIMMNYVRGDVQRATRLGPVTNYSKEFKGGKNFVSRIKPLRWIPEKEVELYAKLKKLPFHPKHCKYRGGLRVDVEACLDMLEKKHTGINFTVVNTFDSVLPGIRSAVKSKHPKIYKCKKCGEPASGKVCKFCQLWKS